MMKELEDAPINGQRVIVRLSLDVPMGEGGEILDDQRLRDSLPTLNYLINRFAKVIIIGHLGRPKGSDQKYSLKPVYLHLSALLKKPIHFAPNHFSVATKTAVEKLSEGQILGIENLRFDPGEEANSRTFAKKLASYGDIFVNDAFSVAHRQAASTVAITEFMSSYPGLRFEQELKTLGQLLKNPSHPFVVIVGGVKVADKLPAIAQLAKRADKILLGGAVASTFLVAKGVDVKKSLIDEQYIEKAKDILKRFREKILLPSDYRWADEMILDIGPETTKLYEKYLKTAHTIFWNGSLGKTENTEFSQSSDAIAKLIADIPATTIVAGGNTNEVISKLKLTNQISFVSSGGGAALELLSGNRLPAIEALN